MSHSAQGAHDDLVMLPELQARRVLNTQPLRVHVLAPMGGYVGRGVLRVLRLRGQGETLELVCGYEGYDRLA